ncbi:hypothetical protein ACIP5Y_22655 [Nocardia sp. NPDC088792]|uniref:hypothetical protein n=1 Tax=Nocardia sp. NPDC088792 TaxID=3364332 RepID=UPI003827A229
MIDMIRHRKSIVAAAALAAAATSLVLAAPDAAADVNSVTVTGTSLSLGVDRFGTGCSYTVQVNGSPYEDVYLNDSNGASFGQQQLRLDNSGNASTTWSPTSTGTHVITAWSWRGGPQFAWEQVGSGLDLGSACVVTS